MNAPVRARDVATGRWRAVLKEFGVPAAALTGKHTACPVCGGKDRFRFDDWQGTGTYYCTSCGSGDGFMLLELVTRQGFKEIANKIELLCGVLPDADEQQDHHKYEDPLKHIRAIWNRARPVRPDGVVGTYLQGRLGTFIETPSIRETQAWHPEHQRMYPAMVSQIASKDGKGVNLHITYLTESGGSYISKRFMKGDLPHGCAIRIGRGGPVMGIAEGIETAMACRVMFSVPVWAAGTADVLSKWEPPAETSKVIIFADNDLNYTGQHKAYQLAHHLMMRRKSDMQVEVRLPSRAGTDWNDELRRLSSP